MTFRFETDYNVNTMTQAAKVLRLTIRKKRSRRSRIFGGTAIACGILLIAAGGGLLRPSGLITAAAALAVAAALCFEDRINGFFAAKRMLSGTQHAVSVFTEAGFCTETSAGKTEWQYDVIRLFAETGQFFVFVLDANYVQLYDKRRMEGGSCEDFRKLIEERIGKEAIFVNGGK